MQMIEATQLINDLGQDIIERITKVIKEKIKNKESHGKYIGADVYKFGDLGAGYIVLARGLAILYLVRYEKVRHNSFHLGRQVLVWRNADDPSGAGFAMHVFEDYLLPKFGSLISDTQQTRNGFGFWQTAILRAFKSNKHVYFLDRRSTPNKLVELSDMEDVVKHKADIWGHDEGHKRTFAIISNKPLRIPS